MKFELNEYHRNVSDIELIADVQATAKKMGKSTLTAKEYSEQGNYHSSTLTRRYGSFIIFTLILIENMVNSQKI